MGEKFVDIWGLNKEKRTIKRIAAPFDDLMNLVEDIESARQQGLSVRDFVIETGKGKTGTYDDVLVKAEYPLGQKPEKN